MAKKLGRRTKYDPTFHPVAAALFAQAGMDEAQIARFLQIARSTLDYWKRRYPEFSDAITEGKAPADALVQSALFRRAIGYDYEELETILDGEVVSRQRVVVKHVPGEVNAQRLWLTNRKPHEWRDRRDITFSDLTDEELIARAAGIVGGAATAAEPEEPADDGGGEPPPASGGDPGGA